LNRSIAFAALVLFSAVPVAFGATAAPNHADAIASLQSQYLAAGTPEQRKQFVGELKALGRNSDIDAGALNSAVAAMLPAATSTWEAEELLAIGAAIPAENANTSALATDPEFLMDARHAADQAGSAKGDVETLADIRIDRLQQDSNGHDGPALAHVQQIWRINTSQGARSFSPRTVLYSGISETLNITRARVLKKDGREEAATISADRPVMKRDEAMYFDARAREVRFVHLQPGDLVEIEYFLLPRAEASAWTGYYARIDQIRDAFAVRLQRRVVIAPSSMQLYAVTRGLHPAAERKQGGESIRIWEARNIESRSSAANGNLPYLHVSTFGSMQEFGRWYSSQILEPALELDENLQKVAQQIAARNLTPNAKVQAVYEAVKRLTKYTGFEFGVHSYQPYPVSTVGRRGFGDCKDKAAMLVALLRAVDVPAEFAMIRTRSAGEMADGAYSLQQFDHAIVYVPELNLYLDGTADAVAALPYNDLGAMAITVDAQGNATRRTVLASAPRSNAPARAQGHSSSGNVTTSMATQQ
jgi:transglutaminase-like putative cysteine protease